MQGEGVRAGPGPPPSPGGWARGPALLDATLVESAGRPMGGPAYEYSYAFAHPQRGRIDMVMYYKDMRQPLVTRSQLLFTFRVNKTLRHFVDEYNPTDPGHLLALCFSPLSLSLSLSLPSFSPLSLSWSRQVFSAVTK